MRQDVCAVSRHVLHALVPEVLRRPDTFTPQQLVRSPQLATFSPWRGVNLSSKT